MASARRSNSHRGSKADELLSSTSSSSITSLSSSSSVGVEDISISQGDSKQKDTNRTSCKFSFEMLVSHIFGLSPNSTCTVCTRPVYQHDIVDRSMLNTLILQKRDFKSTSDSDSGSDQEDGREIEVKPSTHKTYHSSLSIGFSSSFKVDPIKLANLVSDVKWPKHVNIDYPSRHFFSKLENKLSLVPHTKSFWVRLLPGLMEDHHSAEWVRLNIVDKDLSWDDAQEVFSKHFDLADLDDILHSKYDVCKQSAKESVQSYTDRFSSLCHELKLDSSPALQKEAVRKLVNGLNKDILNEFKQFRRISKTNALACNTTSPDFDSLDFVIKTLIRLSVDLGLGSGDTAYTFSNSNYPHNFIKNKSDTGKYCSHHKVNSHSWEECSKNPSNQESYDEMKYHYQSGGSEFSSVTRGNNIDHSSNSDNDQSQISWRENTIIPPSSSSSSSLIEAKSLSYRPTPTEENAPGSEDITTNSSTLVKDISGHALNPVIYSLSSLSFQSSQRGNTYSDDVVEKDDLICSEVKNNIDLKTVSFSSSNLPPPALQPINVDGQAKNVSFTVDKEKIEGCNLSRDEMLKRSMVLEQDPIDNSILVDTSVNRYNIVVKLQLKAVAVAVDKWKIAKYINRALIRVKCNNPLHCVSKISQIPQVGGRAEDLVSCSLFKDWWLYRKKISRYRIPPCWKFLASLVINPTKFAFLKRGVML